MTETVVTGFTQANHRFTLTNTSKLLTLALTEETVLRVTLGLELPFHTVLVLALTKKVQGFVFW